MTDQERPNFSIDRLELVDGIHAAEVDLLLDVKITNRSQEDAENIPVLLLINGQTQSNQTIPKLKAGEQTTPPVRFSVRLNGSGQHRIEVQLQPDTIPDDNRRFLVLNVPEALEVLLISPQTTASDSSALYVRVALSPGGAKSGIRTRIEPPSFLTTKPLNPFNAVFLIDIPLLEPAAVKALEEYVAKGGGVAFFPGQESNLDFLRNELYKNGTGLFPVAPIAETPLDPNFLTKTPDIAVSNHPIFRLFGEGESPLLGSVKIERYLGIEPITPVKDPIQPPQSPQLPKILATLRNGAPLVLEKEFGKGKTVTFLTTAAPVWNNWGRGNPGFVVVMLELAAWLSKRPNETLPVLVGDPINISLDPTLFEQKFVMQRLSNETDSTNFVLESVLREDAGASAVFSQTDQAGFYEAVLKEFSGNEVRKAFAVNVNAKEGDIFLSDVSKLSDLLRSANQSLESAAGFSTAADFSGQQPLTDFLLYAVLTLLIAETFLAGRIIPPLKSR
ncbi:MAG: hypothetical protein LBQ50_08335, partial [Planctomycetaceae bacterium]|jgi:uncharacterized membrane protein|nr:hypothetical protein [Planctomycetaceae bacterium]